MADEEFYTRFTEQHKPEHLNSPEVPHAVNIVFEGLRGKEATQFGRLFQNDALPFVNEGFKTPAQATGCAKHLDACSACATEYGSADRLVRFAGGDRTGVLRLYDLSLETFAQNRKGARAGVAAKEKFRKTGLLSKAVRHFMQTTFDGLAVIDFIYAVTSKANTAAMNFLRRWGVRYGPAERFSKDDPFFSLTRPSLS